MKEKYSGWKRRKKRGESEVGLCFDVSGSEKETQCTQDKCLGRFFK